MVDISHPKYTYKKRGVFYFSKSVPTDLRHHYLKPRIIQSLRTKSLSQARYAAQMLASRLDDYWLNLRLKEAEIPAAHLLHSVPSQNIHSTLFNFWSLPVLVTIPIFSRSEDNDYPANSIFANSSTD